MPTISEVDYELLAHGFKKYRQWFIAGKMGEETYRASLMILGLRGQDLESEIALAKMEKAEGILYGRPSHDNP